jgi:hypothetical protein
MPNMVGYSRLIGLDDADAFVCLSLRREVIDPAIARHGGAIRQTAEDSLPSDPETRE